MSTTAPARFNYRPVVEDGYTYQDEFEVVVKGVVVGTIEKVGSTDYSGRTGSWWEIPAKRNTMFSSKREAAEAAYVRYIVSFFKVMGSI